MLSQLKPAEEVNMLVTDFKGGGVLYKDKGNLLTDQLAKDDDDPPGELMDHFVSEVECDKSNIVERFNVCKSFGLVTAGSSVTPVDEEILPKNEAAPAKIITNKKKTEVSSQLKINENIEIEATSTKKVNDDIVSYDDEEEYSEVTADKNLADFSSTKKVDISAENEDEEEYSEFCNGESEEKFNKNGELSGFSMNTNNEEEEYGECMSGPDAVNIKVEKGEASPGPDAINIKIEKREVSPDHFSAPNSVESNFSGEFDQYSSPKKEPGLCTPTSSGYWSDDAKEGPYFGKIQWLDTEKGFVSVILEDGEQKHVHVSSYDVKCGAESGDLVEFVLGDDTHHGKAAKRVKLVEKGLPGNDEDQIKAQFSLKRSLEISVGWKQEGDNSKKLRTDEIIDVRAGMNVLSDYSDIADADEDISANIKVEAGNEEVYEEELFDHCICSKTILSRCQVCPFFFLEAKVDYSLLEGESATILAKIQGNEGNFKKELKYLRHLPYPFRFLTQNKFQLLKEIGRNSLIPKISPVFNNDYVFITIQNTVANQVTVKSGDILGICQEARLSPSLVSHPFMFESASRQQCFNIPVFIKKSDFTCDDNGIYCGFASLGSGKLNYKNSLMKVILRPDLERKFKLIKAELTVQIKHNVWLELECARGVFERANIGKDGCIGSAASVMDEKGVLSTLSKINLVNNVRQVRTSSTEENVTTKADDDKAYEDMLSQIDKDMKANHSIMRNNQKKEDYLLERTYKGIVGGVEALSIPPKGEIETYLYLHDEEVLDQKNLKKLLKFQARVTNNDEFKYYNNCYNIEEQYPTIVSGICRTSRTTKPAVKVKITNPRNEITILRNNSPLALIKVHFENVSSEKAPSVEAPSAPVKNSAKLSVTQYLLKSKQDKEDVGPPVVPVQNIPEVDFDAGKFLEKRQKKFTRKWDLICAEGTFHKSLMVEDKYPYFTNKLKIPFGLKDSHDLNMRVGISQDSKPVKVLDKVNGVFTCTICDVVTLDRFSVQDHWYSAKHKQNMKQVQVIAGLEERLLMNRPVIQEMFDQFHLCPLIGLDHIVEVLQGHLEPCYHCSLCNIDISLSEVIHHLTSLNHQLTFIKEFFALAWARFSLLHDFSTWLKSDFECLDLVVNKIDQVHGRKKPSIVANKTKLEEIVEPVKRINSYSARRTELDTYFKTLPAAEPRKAVQKPPPLKTQSKLSTEIVNCDGTTIDDFEVPPNSCLSIVLKMRENQQSSNVKFVRVSQGKGYFGPAKIRPSFSRLWSEGLNTFIKATVVNTVNYKISIFKGTGLGLLTWSQ